MFFEHLNDAWRNGTLEEVFVRSSEPWVIGSFRVADFADRQNQIADRARTCNRQCLRANYVTNRGAT